jgi:transposase
VDRQTKITIQNELASIRKQYELKKGLLQTEAVTLIELMFGLFNIVFLSMGVKATSQNSHLPPSQDPHREKKPKKKGKKKKGGQFGHQGRSLEQVEKPDEVLLHAVSNCDLCQSSLKEEKLHHITRHQVFDINLSVKVSEHQVEHKLCRCGYHQAAKLPAGVSQAPCSYGPSVKAMAVELTQIQFVPLKRATEFFSNKLGLPLSQTSLINFNREFHELLKEKWEPGAITDLKKADVLNVDETGTNVNGKKAWIHTASSELVVLLKPHWSRGAEAMDEMDIIPHHRSILCHDFWGPYGGYDAIHAACNSHLKRELEKASVDYGQNWAKKMSKLLQSANELRKKHDGILKWDQVQSIEKRYTEILRQAELECPQKLIRQKQRGRIGQPYPRQLLNRFKTKRSWVLMFIYDPRVPFTNNQAERDIRLAKVQQKVSGCFRTFEGAERFCLARSFVLSMNRQGKNVHEATEAIFRGT